MKDERESRGRKARLANPGERVSLGLKVTADVKNKLDGEAKLNGRTQSQEAEARLDRSFHHQDLLSEVMELNLPEYDVSLGWLIMRPFFLPRQAPYFHLREPSRSSWG